MKTWFFRWQCFRCGWLSEPIQWPDKASCPTCPPIDHRAKPTYAPTLDWLDGRKKLAALADFNDWERIITPALINFHTREVVLEAVERIKSKQLVYSVYGWMVVEGVGLYYLPSNERPCDCPGNRKKTCVHHAMVTLAKAITPDQRYERSDYLATLAKKSRRRR